MDEFTVIVGCDSGDIFQMDILTFDSSLLSTCHTGLIKDVAFPRLVLYYLNLPIDDFRMHSNAPVFKLANITIGF